MGNIDIFFFPLFPTQFLVGFTVDFGTEENPTMAFELMFGFFGIGVYLWRHN